MAKKNDLASVNSALEKKAAEFGFVLRDVELVREGKVYFLRIYIDKPGGITLDDCETYHRAIVDLVDAIDFDYLEVSSPGLDHPLKKKADFDSHTGELIEVHLYRAYEGTGTKVFIGELLDVTADGDTVKSFRIKNESSQMEFRMNEVSLVKPYIVFNGDE